MPQAIVPLVTFAAEAAFGAGVAAGTAVGLGTVGAIAVGEILYVGVEVAIYAGLAIGAAAAAAPKMPHPEATQTPIRQPMPVRQSAFGTVRVAGAYALFTVGTGSSGKKVSHDVLALLDGRSERIVSYYLNDDLMAPVGSYWYAPGASGKYGGGGSNPPNLVQIDSRLGLSTETAYAISSTVPVWTSDHRGDGVTSLLLRCKAAKRDDQSGDFPSGLPSPSAVVDSQLIYDPRDGGQTQGVASTYAFSDNPPLCLLAFLTDARGGMGLDYNRFLLPTIAYLAAAADECDGVVDVSGMHATLADAADAGDNTIFLNDTTGLTVGAVIDLPTESVTVASLGGSGEVGLTGDLLYAHSAGELAYWDADGQQVRYRCAGTYRHDNAPGDVIKSILSSFDGWIGARGDGALVVRTNTVYEPTVILTDRHIVGYQVQHYLPDEQATNQLIVSYTDPAGAFNKAEAGYLQDDADIAERGQLRSQELNLDWVPSGPQALSVGRAVLARAVQPLRGTLTCNLAGLAVMGERYVRIQVSELPALNDLVVEVTGRVSIDLSSMSVSFPWIATGVEVGSSPGDSDTPDTLPPLGPPSGSPFDPLDAPTITSITPDYPDSGGGVSGARLLIEVSDEGDDVAWKVRWKLSADTSWTEIGVSDPTGSPPELLTGLIAASGSVDVQVAYLTATQVSPWSATSSVTVGAPSTSTADATASEALAANDLVNIHTGGVRKADAAAGYAAHGYVTAAVSSGATATVQFDGQIAGLSGLTKGPVYLSTTAGGITNTVPTGSGQIVQQIGVATSASSVDFEPQEEITLR